MTDEEAVLQFVEQLIAEMGLGDVDEKKKSRLQEKLSEKLIDEINRALIAVLPEEKLVILENLPEDARASEKVAEMVEEAGIDTKKLVSEVLEEFRTAILEECKDEA